MRNARVLLCVLLGSLVLTIMAATTPQPADTACAPYIGVSTRVLERVRGNPAVMEATLQAGASVPGGDRLTRVNIGSANNAAVEVDGRRAALPAVVTLDPAVPSWSFVVAS